MNVQKELRSLIIFFLTYKKNDKKKYDKKKLISAEIQTPTSAVGLHTIDHYTNGS